jgi:hypothetical protein
VTTTFTIDDSVSGWCFEVLENPKIENTYDVGLFIEKDKVCLNIGYVIDASDAEDNNFINALVENKAKLTIIIWKLPVQRMAAKLTAASKLRKEYSAIQLGLHIPDIYAESNVHMTREQIIWGFYEIRSNLLLKKVYPMSMVLREYIENVVQGKPILPLDVKEVYRCPTASTIASIKAFVKLRSKMGKKEASGSKVKRGSKQRAREDSSKGSSKSKREESTKKRPRTTFEICGLEEEGQIVKMREEATPNDLLAEVMATKDKKKVVSLENTKESLEAFEKYYPFAPKTFDIEVDRCNRAPSKMIYRPLDEQHCRNIIGSFLKNVRDVDTLADLVPYVPVANMEVIVKKEEELLRENGLMFWIINGQHTIHAAKALQTMSLRPANASGA